MSTKSSHTDALKEILPRQVEGEDLLKMPTHKLPKALKKDDENDQDDIQRPTDDRPTDRPTELLKVELKQRAQRAR